MRENTSAQSVGLLPSGMWLRTTCDYGMMRKCFVSAVSISGHGKYLNTYERVAMPVEDDVPEHVQYVRNMDEDELLRECNSILALKTVEPERTVPDSFKDEKSK